MPYSDNYSTVADVDFVSTPSAIFSTQPTFSSVDSILADQLGPILNPVTSNSNNVVPVTLPPVLAKQNVDNVVPIISASSGADINLSTTLNQPNNSNFMPVDSIVQNYSWSPSVNTQIQVPIPTIIPPTPVESFVPNVPIAPVKPTAHVKPTAPVTPPQPVAQPMPEHFAQPMTSETKPIAFIPIETFKNMNTVNTNMNMNKPNTDAKMNNIFQQRLIREGINSFVKDLTTSKNTILAQKEHFGRRKRKEHFGGNKGILDIILLIILVGALAYYVYAAWTPELEGQLQKTLRGMWPYSSLHNPDITDNHKLIIILSILLVFIILIRVL
jgi:hypothetical protein